MFNNENSEPVDGIIYLFYKRNIKYDAMSYKRLKDNLKCISIKFDSIKIIPAKKSDENISSVEIIQGVFMYPAVYIHFSETITRTMTTFISL